MSLKSKKEDTHEIELSQEEFEEVLADIEEFDHASFSYLAESKEYEIIPTTLETGQVLGSKEIAMLKLECQRLGAAILYRVDQPNGETLLIHPTPNTVRIMVLKEGMQ